MKQLTVFFAAAFSAATIIASANAHHSFAAVFDANDPVEFEGIVTRVDWLNPHVWFYIDVANDDGTVDNWAFEMGSPNRLQRYGWHEESLPPGQKINVSGSRARDGSMKAAVTTVILPGGRELFGAQDAAPQ